MATSPAKFLREVRQEMHKVTWPSRRETIASTAMVLILCFICALLFMFIDGALGWGVQLILGLGGK